MNFLNDLQVSRCLAVSIKHLYTILLVIFVWNAALSQSVDKTLFAGAEDLALQLERQLPKGGSTAIAVTELTDIEKRRSNLGRLLAEEITTRLIQSTKCRVVERALLDKVLKEKSWQLSDLFDPERLLQFGKFVGADAVVAGSYAVFASNVKINVRLIQTETGQVIAAGSTSIIKDKDVVVLDESGPEGRVQHPTFELPEAPPPQPKPRSQAGEVIYKEDFSRYDVGDVLLDWGANLSVLIGPGRRKVLGTQTPGIHTASRKISFPANFSLEIEFVGRNLRGWHGHEGTSPTLVDQDGREIKLHLHGNAPTFQLPGTEYINANPWNTEGVFKLVKKGTSYKIYWRGEFIVSGDYADYGRFEELRFRVRKNDFIWRILVTDLGD